VPDGVVPYRQWDTRAKKIALNAISFPIFGDAGKPRYELMALYAAGYAFYRLAGSLHTYVSMWRILDPLDVVRQGCH
jgi:hypothetical protein